MIPSPTTFGLDMGPSDPHNNGPQLGFPDTNIYFFMFPSLLRCLVSEGSISFKLSCPCFTIACK